jgi:hypothetical protein
MAPQLFHLANQREARTSTEIATSTAMVCSDRMDASLHQHLLTCSKVAEQTQRGSASMITIAAMTMFFLPGTFVSAILSTTFFDFDSDGLSVSRQWWILLVTTIPLTVLVFGTWLYWRAIRLSKRYPAAPSTRWSRLMRRLFWWLM